LPSAAAKVPQADLTVSFRGMSFASYAHIHASAQPGWAPAFVSAAAAYRSAADNKNKKLYSRI